MAYSGLHPSVSSQPPQVRTQYAIPNSISLDRSSGRRATTFGGRSDRSSRSRIPRGQGAFLIIRADQGSSGYRDDSFAIYSPACMRTMATLASNSANQTSRESATASSYEAPRFRMPCAPFRCASTKRERNLHRFSNAFGSVRASSSRSANRSQPSTDGSGIWTVFNPTGSPNPQPLAYAPRQPEFINAGNYDRNKINPVHENDGFVSRATVVGSLPDARETFSVGFPTDSIRPAAPIRDADGPAAAGGLGRSRANLSATTADQRAGRAIIIENRHALSPPGR